MPANPDAIDYPQLHEAARSWRWQPAADCLAGRNILITGAGDGIGACAAKTFACFGANPILLGRTKAKLDAVYDWIQQHTPARATIVPCDLEHLADNNAQALAQAIEADYGELHGLLHNASLLGSLVPLSAHATAEWDRAFRVNVQAPMVLTRELLPLMPGTQKPAAILFTSSSVGRAGRAFWGAYAASKFAVEGMMQTLADELEASTSITVASINPGATRTGMRARAYPAEDPASIAVAEAHMDLYLHVFAGHRREHHGQALDARHWEGPAT